MTFTKIGFGLNARLRQNRSWQNLVPYQVSPTSRYYPICVIIIAQKWGHIYVVKKQRDYGQRMVFWPDWPVGRCSVKTRRGTACLSAANKKNGRCRGCTGPRTAEGRARISAAKLLHGNFTKEKLEKRRENAAKRREIRRERCQISLT